jgi:hypothetical protein
VTERAPVALTVAIPTYNRRDELLSLLRAIVPQLLPDDELLVVLAVPKTECRNRDRRILRS